MEVKLDIVLDTESITLVLTDNCPHIPSANSMEAARDEFDR